jgi:hypothetical protein
MTYPFL